ncbi:MAG: DUF58 domain-containing protein [Deltaproteobacteria bacterium]|nr:DUF58 domain-containing protein [Deltaproteobacteria bacterium]
MRARRWTRGVEVWTQRIHPHRRLHLTREGWFFLLVTIAIGMAALNTGHNLFYLVFAMLVSLIVVSGLLSERAVRHLAIERRLPAEVFARSAVAAELRVRNRSRRWASYAVEIRDGIEGEERRRIGFLDRLDPGAERSFVSLWTFPRRGRRGFRALHLVTRFPFGLFEKTRIVPAGDPVVVFPAVSGGAGRRSSRGLEGQALRKHRSGEEMIGLRRKLADDDPRRIHWRVSARIGDWMVTEQAVSVDRPLAIFFDGRGPAGEAFEAAVAAAATLLWQSSRGGRTACLYSWAASFVDDSPQALRAALAFLAEVEAGAADGAAAEERFRAWRIEVERSGGGVFVTAGEAPKLPPGAVLRVA